MIDNFNLIGVNSKDVRIRIIEADTSESLEDRINKWLSDRDVTLVNISYTRISGYYGYEAYIVYKPKKN